MRVVCPADGGGGVEGCASVFVEPGEHGRGVIGLNDAGAALFAVLPAPVGVVEVVIYQIVDFLISGGSGGALCRTAECCKGQAVVLVQDFFQRQEQAAAVVECSIDDAFFGVATYAADCEGPAVLAQTGGVGGHSAEHIV